MRFLSTRKIANVSAKAKSATAASSGCSDISENISPKADWPRLNHGEHTVEGDAGVVRRLIIDLHLVYEVTLCKLLYRPGQIGRVDAVHGRAGANHRVEAEHGLVRVLVGQTADEVDFRADRPRAAGSALRDYLRDEFSRAVHICSLHHLVAALGMH